MVRLPPDYLILKRREQEDARRVYEDHGREQSKVGATTAFEVRTDAALGARRLNERYNRLRQQDAAALEGRRRRLAELLAAEQAEQAAALEALEETPEQRKEKMVARAKELRERREAEKQAFVKEQYASATACTSPSVKPSSRYMVMEYTNCLGAPGAGVASNTTEPASAPDCRSWSRRDRYGRDPSAPSPPPSCAGCVATTGGGGG